MIVLSGKEVLHPFLPRWFGDRNSSGFMKCDQRLAGGIGICLPMREFCPSTIRPLQSEQVACGAAAFAGARTRPMQAEKAEGEVLGIVRLRREQPRSGARQPLIYFSRRLRRHMQLHG